ncbi:hypothetical protein RND81_09G261200 [Saponaria officinalis]|uniref:Transmembrane protein n=1 Tax=Saponaria officinalis TaxID=3572 RepID=A0AAW1IS78_SAPOF
MGILYQIKPQSYFIIFFFLKSPNYFNFFIDLQEIKMAFRGPGYLRSMMQQRRSYSTTGQSKVRKSMWMTASAAPIWIVGGLVLIAGGIAVHTGKQQLLHSPSVHVSKRRRESYPEADDPTRSVKHGGNFVDKSFLRKVAHIQDESKQTLPKNDPDSIYTRSREAETLASIKR